MKKIRVLIPILFLSITSFSQVTPEEITAKFFREYEKEGASVALDNLYATNAWMTRIADAISNIKSQMEGLNEDFVGKYYGYELITEKNLSESYKLMSYLVKYDRQPFRFTFQFYKPDKEWTIYSFQFDSDIDDEIEEAAKLNYILFEN